LQIFTSNETNAFVFTPLNSKICSKLSSEEEKDFFSFFKISTKPFFTQLLSKVQRNLQI